MLPLNNLDSLFNAGKQYLGQGQPTNAPGAPGGGAPKKSNEIRQPEFKLPDPAAWNYKNSILGPRGEQLPKNAQGWTPYGTPYFGPGLKGKLQQYGWMFTRNIQAPEPEEWEALKEQFAKFQNTPVEEIGGTERLAALGQGISMAWQAGSADDSLLSIPLRVTQVGVTALGDLFNIPAIGVERAGGAFQSFKEAVNDLESPLPQLDANWFTQTMENTPLGIGYDFLRLALSPEQGKWETVKGEIKDGWEAGRIFYSQMFDKELRGEFLRRYRNGENAELLAMELENPLAEGIGQFLGDPLNFVGLITKVAKSGRMIDAASDLLRASGTMADVKAAQFVDEFAGLTDETQAVAKWQDFTKAQMQAVKATREGSVLKQAYKAGALTASSRAKVVLQQSSDWMNSMTQIARKEGYAVDDMADFLAAGVLSVSDNASEVQKGASILMHFPTPRFMFSEPAIQTFEVVRNLLKSESGVLDGSRLMRLYETKDFTKFAEEATALLTRAADDYFPAVTDMKEAAKLAKKAASEGTTVSRKTTELAQQYEEVAPVIRYTTSMNQPLEFGKNKVNAVLGTAYFAAQPGPAVRNILQNNITILIDEGPKAFLRNGEFWTDGKVSKDIERVFGFTPKTASGFTTLSQSEGGTLRKGFSALMEKGETASAKRVILSAGKNAMDKLIPMAADTSKLVDKGFTDRQATYLLRLMKDNYGDTEAVSKAFRNRFGQGSTETWRYLDFVSDHHEKGLKELDLWDEITNLAETAQSREEVEAVFARLGKGILERAAEAGKDIPGVASERIGAEVIAHFEEAVSEGVLTDRTQTAVFAAVMEASGQAKDQYLEALRDGVMLSQRRLGETPAAIEISQNYQKFAKALDEGGRSTQQKVKGIMDSAWSWTREIRGNKKPDLAAYWTRIGLEGPPPADLTKESLLKTLWEKHTFPRASGEWETYFGTAFAGSEEMVQALGKVMDTTDLKSQFTRAQYSVQRAQAYRTAVYKNGRLTVNPKQSVMDLAKLYGIPTATEEGAPLNKAMMGILNKYGVAADKLEDVTPENAIQAFEKWRIENGRPDVGLEGLAIPAAYPIGSMPSVGRAWNENSKGALRALDQVKNDILARWGQKDTAALTPAIEQGLKQYLKEAAPRIKESKAIALKYAENVREFTLLNYDKKTYADLAWSYFMPYRFWYAGTYRNWLKRIATDPGIIAGYARHKQMMEKLHADSPDWYKQQVNLGSLLGMGDDNPLIFNLEAMIWPLYGLTGTDFNDPVKRTNWFTSSLDDAGKFGPSIWMPITMATATVLKLRGQEDQAARWAGRAIPETKTIKELTGAWFGKPLELDPAVQTFSGDGLLDFDALDAYEAGRVGRALGAMIQDGMTQEQATDAANAKSGPIWEEAITRATQLRAGPGGAYALLSYFGGPGLRARTQEDVQIDNMFSDLRQLQAMNAADALTPDEYRQGWDQLRERYNFMDTVLLSRKGGEFRDSAYAYNVLGRIQPGQADDLLGIVGITQDDISKFYDSKGWTAEGTKLTDTERARFMAAITDLAAIYKMPAYATKQEWNQARDAYGEMYEGAKTEFGDDIWDKVSVYYDKLDESKQAGADYAEKFPEVYDALNYKKQTIAFDPMLYKYYGSIETIDSYWDGVVRQKLYDEFGEDIAQKWDQYYTLKLTDSKAASQYMKAHPELKQYSARKTELSTQANQQFVNMAQYLPDRPQVDIREDFVPESPAQQLLADAVNPPSDIPTWSQWQEVLNDPMQEYVIQYWQTGEMPAVARSELEYLTGMDFNQAIRLVGLSLAQP